MKEVSCLSSKLRREPKQQRGKERVSKILAAAAVVFEEVGYSAATTHLIAANAGTAIGSLYQFFPDKAAIFQAMELYHVDRVKAMWAGAGSSDLSRLSLRETIHLLMQGVIEIFSDPVSRIVFIQFFESREIFQSIDDSFTQEAIEFMANILQQRNPNLANPLLLAEVCVHSSNALILHMLRTTDQQHVQQLTQQTEDLIVSYLAAHVGDKSLGNVMKVMKCRHCRSSNLSKNGYRRGKQCYLCKECGKQFLGQQQSLVPKAIELSSTAAEYTLDYLTPST
jgi:AcrR family transcriptional regulator